MRATLARCTVHRWRGTCSRCGCASHTCAARAVCMSPTGVTGAHPKISASIHTWGCEGAGGGGTMSGGPIHAPSRLTMWSQPLNLVVSSISLTRDCRQGVESKNEDIRGHQGDTQCIYAPHASQCSCTCGRNYGRSMCNRCDSAAGVSVHERGGLLPAHNHRQDHTRTDSACSQAAQATHRLVTVQAHTQQTKNRSIDA